MFFGDPRPDQTPHRPEAMRLLADSAKVTGAKKACLVGINYRTTPTGTSREARGEIHGERGVSSGERGVSTGGKLFWFCGVFWFILVMMTVVLMMHVRETCSKRTKDSQR